MKVWRIIRTLLIVIFIIVIAAVSGGMYYFKSYLPDKAAAQSFPQTSGEITAAGLTKPVEVYRDSIGIPHIYAASVRDLFFAQGYVQAQDRFWQMDTWRHIGSGTLSEMFGRGQVETDAFLRTLGWKQTAEAEWEQMGATSREILTAYSDGVNAYLSDHSGTAVSLEYAVLKLLAPDYRIASWTPVNSLTWGKAMAWDLRGNMDEEIERAVLLKTLTPQQVAELYPPYPQDHPVIVNQFTPAVPVSTSPAAGTLSALPSSTLTRVSANIARLNGLLGSGGDGIGSNSWVVAGSRTSSGKPLLANDPHLSIQMPSIWYQVGLHCQPKSDECPYNTAGFSFAGVPGVVIGHNDRIAWGFTNVGPDVMDLYIEKVNPANPNQYEVNGQWVDFVKREETIQIAGGQSVNLTARATRHGPVVSDTFGPLKDKSETRDKEFVPFRDKSGIELPADYVIALKWTALSPSTPFEAVWELDKAQNWQDFRAAASNFHVPAQNLIYADVDGNIGYQMPGYIPVRAAGDGRLPVPGWTDEYEWTGFLPFEDLPNSYNPPEGYIVTANNQVPPRGYPYLISTDWDYGFRANRIIKMITGASAPIDVSTFQIMQGDSYDTNAEVFIPLLIDAVGKAGKPSTATALDLLINWNYQAKADSSAAAIFAAFWRHLLQNTFNDDLPKAYWPEGGSRWNEVMRRLPADSRWWDDQQTKNHVETRREILVRSFDEAVSELRKQYGSNPTKWKWGDMHAATFRNQTLGESGIGLIEDLFNRGPFPTGGGQSIVNATGWSATDGYQTDWLPSMRMIVDLSNLSSSLSVHTTGQSGHAFNPHYADLASLWAAVKYYPMLWDKAAVMQDVEGKLLLKP